MTPLPKLMVAPNGARRGRHDHPAIPLTDDEIVETALACFEAGADGIHVHIRDGDEAHVLDAAHYRALLERLARELPDLYVQVTSESGGRYSAADQQRVMKELHPDHVSVALREMVRSPRDWPAAQEFYAWAYSNDVSVQHILYSTMELEAFIGAVKSGKVPGQHHLLQFVLGTYDGKVPSTLEGVSAFIELLARAPANLSFDWMLCAFGQAETDCLLEAVRQGGKVRIGFENSLTHADGRLALSNAERVTAFLEAQAALRLPA